MKGVGIVGIGTDVGKTVVSAMISEVLKANYFKPIQAGDLDNSDSIKIARWCSKEVIVEEEIFRLQRPMAPHAAAELEGRELNLIDIDFPVTDNYVVLEGAGGLMVPLNKKESLLDIYKKSNLPVIVVSRNYLGSINHTLLTVDRLKQEGIPILGIVFTGEENSATQQIILEITECKQLGFVKLPAEIDAAFIREKSKAFQIVKDLLDK
jgi:dethiobiotin synthetase